MKSKYDLPGIHHVGASFTHSGSLTRSITTRVAHLHAEQQEKKVATHVDLASVLTKLKKLTASFHDDGDILTKVSSKMDATEKQIESQMKKYGADAAAILKTAHGGADTMLASTGLATATTTIKYGATGDAVKSLQRRLKKAGYDPGPLDGIYGPKTLAAVQAYQKAHDLLVSSKTGKLVESIANPGSRPSTAGGGTSTPIGSGTGKSGDKDVQKILDIAKSQLGEGEHPPGSNNTKYGSWFDPKHPAEPWCARFVSWVYAKSGHPLPAIQGDKGFQYVPYGVTYAKQHGIWHAGTAGIKPGDVVCFDWQGDGVADHTGIATSTQHADGSVSTIEGNDSQNHVATHVRPRGNVMGYFRPE